MTHIRLSFYPIVPLVQDYLIQRKCFNTLQNYLRIHLVNRNNQNVSQNQLGFRIQVNDEWKYFKMDKIHLELFKKFLMQKFLIKIFIQYLRRYLQMVVEHMDIGIQIQESINGQNMAFKSLKIVQTNKYELYIIQNELGFYNQIQRIVNIKNQRFKIRQYLFVESENFSTLKLMDFSLAVTKNDPIKQCKRVYGTSGYMASEVIKNEILYDERIDIFSVGVLLWEIQRFKFYNRIQNCKFIEGDSLEDIQIK